MYKCPGCGGELDFNPKEQIIICRYCGKRFTAEELNKEAEAKEAEGRRMLEGTVYTCSQCGGRILCNDDTGVTFCSYCGSQALIPEKMEAEEPELIIPFKITKEECERIYRDKIKKAWFLPNEFRQDTTIEKFRGIYMPFWMMSGKGRYSKKISAQKNTIETEIEERKKTRKKYDVTRFYNLDVSAEGRYEGLIFDASSSLPDDVADAVLQYNMKESKTFDPAYMAGFYADVGDVPKEVYFSKAEKYISNQMAYDIRQSGEVRRYGDADIAQSDVEADSFEAVKGFFPVWFLSVKNAGGKMSYAVINGLDGKIYMDLPLDYGKYLLLSLCIAVPVFLILLAFTMVPTTLLKITVVLLAISAFFFVSGVDELYIRRHSLDDWGKRYAEKMDMPGLKDEKKRRGGKMSPVGKGCLITGVILVGIPVLTVILLVLTGINLVTYVVEIVFAALFIYYVILVLTKKGKTSGKAVRYKIPAAAKLAVTAPAFAGVLIASAVLMTTPANDLWYYMAAVLCMVILCIMVLLMVMNVNKMALRKPAQLGKRGENGNE